jgi:hypothetical protein
MPALLVWHILNHWAFQATAPAVLDGATGAFSKIAMGVPSN